MEVLESEHLMTVRLGYAISCAALNSSPHADLEKGSQKTYTLYRKALEAIPYLVAGSVQSGPEGITAERMEAVRKFREMQKQRQQPGSK